MLLPLLFNIVLKVSVRQLGNKAKQKSSRKEEVKLYLFILNIIFHRWKNSMDGEFTEKNPTTIRTNKQVHRDYRIHDQHTKIFCISMYFP